MQVGVLSSLSGPECEGGTSEYVSVAAYAEWLEEAVRELGGAKLARINKVEFRGSGGRVQHEQAAAEGGYRGGCAGAGG
eukprot:scaffold47510_cov42-Phaeocystis_antarctica.AAC.2